MILVGLRPSPLIGGTPKRAVLVGCDFPGCQAALEVPVNLQATDYQCRNDTIRYIMRARPQGWFTDRHKFLCGAHSPKNGG